jgi:hypothetical protein
MLVVAQLERFIEGMYQCQHFVRHLGEAKAVMAGLDPAIHLLQKYALRRLMDTRVKPAYDNGEYRSALPAITTDHASFHFRKLRRRLAGDLPECV